jgi:hypothetical protein
VREDRMNERKAGGKKTANDETRKRAKVRKRVKK